MDHDEPPSSERSCASGSGHLHDNRANPFRQSDPLAPPACPETLGLSDLDRALGELPEQQRAVILLAGLEGMSDDQRTNLRISVHTMRSELAHARANLFGLLGVRKHLLQAA